MAKRKQARFKRIVITSREQLGNLCHLADGISVADFNEAYRLVTTTKPAGQLERWLHAHGLRICSTGRRKLLAAAGRNTSWRAYMKARWNTADGAVHWFEDNDEELFGTHRLHFRPDWGHHESFNDFLEANKGIKIKWAKWPFRALARARKAKRR